jgi:hypothetical protein
MAEWWMINMPLGLPQKVILLHRERIRREIRVTVTRNNPKVLGGNSRDTIETTIFSNMAVLEISHTVKITIHSGTATMADMITVSRVKETDRVMDHHETTITTGNHLTTTMECILRGDRSTTTITTILPHDTTIAIITVATTDSGVPTRIVRISVPPARIRPGDRPCHPMTMVPGKSPGTGARKSVLCGY